jgi:hypothetical protein
MVFAKLATDADADDLEAGSPGPKDVRHQRRMGVSQ